LAREDEWAAQIEVGEELARTLIAGTYPALLRGGRLRRLGEGWDNVVWATAGGAAFRFPRRRVALAGVRREMALLPRLAPSLPLAIPDAAYPGAPTNEFPWPWFGSRIVEGREIADCEPLTDTQRMALAVELAGFLRALHALDLPAARALPLDPMGRTDMAVRVPRTRDALARAGVDDERARGAARRRAPARARAAGPRPRRPARPPPARRRRRAAARPRAGAVSVRGACRLRARRADGVAGARGAGGSGAGAHQRRMSERRARST
jgi:aminoglycoside phosphotransferase (APT) family kinase protein